MDKLTDGDPSSLKPVSKDGDGVPIRLGDHVKFYDKFVIRHRGVVRWIGTNKALLPDGTRIVGIEAVSDIQNIVCYVHVQKLTFKGKSICNSAIVLRMFYGTAINTCSINICYLKGFVESSKLCLLWYQDS